MEILFLFGSIQAIFFVLLLLTKQQKQLHDKILMVWFGAIALHLFAVYGAFQQLYLNHDYILYLSPLAESLVYFHGPALLIYTQLLIAKKPKFKSIYWVHFMVFFISVLTIIVLYFLNGEVLSFFMNLNIEAPIYYEVSRFLNQIHGPVYIIWVILILKRHHKNLKNNFSFTEEVNLKWLLSITIGFSVIWVSVIFALVFDLPFEGDSLVFTTATAFVFLFGYLGLKQGNIFAEVTRIPVESLTHDDTKYEHSKLDPKLAKNTSQKLLEIMDTQRPFLKSRLTADEIATNLQISTHQLSQLLNQYLGKTFFDFINEYRVKEAQLLLDDPRFDHYTVLGIAIDSGFNSKSSFNRIFKKHTGLTPTEFKQITREKSTM